LVDPDPAPLSAQLQQLQMAVVALPPIERFQVLLPAAGQEDLSAYDLRPAAVMQTGARILHLLAAIAVGEQSIGTGVTQVLQQHWTPGNPHGARLINAALIMCADHELNVSSFTARCVASAQATPYDVVVAGLSALQGVRHGRTTERVEAFLREVDEPQAARAVVAARLRRGEPIPGFGHQLYPAGDPRGRALLDLTRAGLPNSPAVTLADAVVAEVEQVTGERHTIDFSLVTLAWALELPPGSALTLFALGRTIGWIGQAIEQYQLGKMIRPRAHYVGELPVSDER
jgi:citrate synthase